MKFVDLGKSLKQNISNIYVLFGEDSFLKSRAIEMIIQACAITDKSMNVNEFYEPKTLSDVLVSADTIPFFDNKKVVVCKNFNFTKTMKEKSQLEKYIKSPMESSVLIFENDSDTFLNIFFEGYCVVDCREIDISSACKWMIVNAKKSGVTIEEKVSRKLFEFCNGKMSRIVNELPKLTARAGIGNSISAELVEEMCEPEKEYTVFQLTDEIANENKAKACDILFSLTEKEKSIFVFLKPMYMHFRRLLFVKISKNSIEELAKILGVKEYAIKMSKKQAEKFSAKELKKIVDALSKVEEDVKSGKLLENTAIKVATLNILQSRG